MTVRQDDETMVAGVRITNPDRVLFDEQGASKRDLIEHYLSVADYMLPHVNDRPLALVRCPQGSEKGCFYQKHASPGFPSALHKVTIAEKSGEGEYLYVREIAGIIAAAQMGVLEIHIWASRRDRLESPDRLVFDLDPDEALDFALVKQAAMEMRERLEAAGLRSFVLATGGKGLHVVAPLQRRHGWAEHKEFAHTIVLEMAADSPEKFVTTMSKAQRRGRIFLDYLRNDRGSTAIAPLSTRAKPGAPVAFPLTWEELPTLADARPVRLGEAAARLAKGDPWPDYFALRQRLSSVKTRKS